MANLLLIYNHKENSARASHSSTNGLLGYHKEDKSFSCEASDMDCMGVRNLPPIFDLMIAKNGHKKTFILKRTHRDDELETTHWEYKANDNSGFTFIIWND